MRGNINLAQPNEATQGCFSIRSALFAICAFLCNFVLQLINRLRFYPINDKALT